jgi:two-component system LytT family response regulator
MDKIKIIIADDNEQARTINRRFLETLPYAEIVAEVEDGEFLLREVIVEEPQLVLLDINMPKLNGIDAIKECIKILPNLNVIIISGHAEYAIDAFGFSAIDYLVKPIERNRLYQAMEKARQHINSQNDDELRQFLKLREEKLLINSEGLLLFIQKRDIFFVEKIGRKNLIHTAKRKYEVAETLGGLMKKLDPNRFFQTHRAYIVNFDRVSFIKPEGDTNLVYFDNYDQPAYISKNKMNELLYYFKKIGS